MSASITDDSPGQNTLNNSHCKSTVYCVGHKHLKLAVRLNTKKKKQLADVSRELNSFLFITCTVAGDEGCFQFRGEKKIKFICSAFGLFLFVD